MTEIIHNYPRGLERAKAWVRRAKISANNRDLILRWSEKLVVWGYQPSRVMKYIYSLTKLASWLGTDFTQATEDDINRVVARIETSQYMPFGKRELKMMLKKLYQWLAGMRETGEYPPLVSWITLRMREKDRRKLPEDMLVEEEVLRLVDAAQNPRDRAFVMLLYESGFRIGEIMGMRMKDVIIENGFARIRVDGKTGARQIPVITSVPYLVEWINQHPRRDDREAYIWIARHGGLPEYHVVCEALRRLARRAGVHKKVNPHNFRHSRATFLANYLSEAQMCSYFGWIMGSSMTRIYVHMSGREIDGPILSMHGLQENNERKHNTANPKVCSRCDHQNQTTSRYCSKCTMPLSKMQALELVKEQLETRDSGAMLDEMLRDSQFRRLFEDRAKEIWKTFDLRRKGKAA